MPRYFAFLRAINVGGRSTIKMEALRRAFEGLGFTDVETLIASGNVSFMSSARGAVPLEKKIESALKTRLKINVDVLVRSENELRAVSRRRPFSGPALRQGDLNVIFMRERLEAARKRKLGELETRSDSFRQYGREVYWLRQRGPDRSDYASVPLDRVLPAPFTVRSMRTVMKLAAKFRKP